jgi:hypothetical protein
MGQIITCTSNGTITAGTGTIVMTGIVSKYAATGQTITKILVNDASKSKILCADLSGPVTDTVASDAATSLVLGTNSVVGMAGNSTLTFTLGYAMANTDTVVFTVPANLDVSKATFSADTFGGAGAFTCNAMLQIITCTSNGTITAGTGTIIMTGIVSKYAATSQTITSFSINDVSAGGADISSDASGPVTDTVEA